MIFCWIIWVEPRPILAPQQESPQKRRQRPFLRHGDAEIHQTKNLSQTCLCEISLADKACEEQRLTPYPYPTVESGERAFRGTSVSPRRTKGLTEKTVTTSLSKQFWCCWDSLGGHITGDKLKTLDPKHPVVIIPPLAVRSCCLPTLSIHGILIPLAITQRPCETSWSPGANIQVSPATI